METIDTLLEKIYNNKISECTFLGGLQTYKEPNDLEKDIIINIKKLKKQYPNSIFICQKNNKLKNTYDLTVIHPDDKLEFSAVYTRRIFNVKYTLEEKYKTFINIWTTNIKRKSINYDFYFIY
ncbi:hypothetical protein EOM09_02755 [bacterium]|nr:hypothetical protein [bacterium]